MKTSEWEIYLKQRLSGTGFGKAILNCDGDKITFQEVVYKRRILIQWYYNGQWKGEYSTLRSEIGIKYGYPKYVKPSAAVINLERIYRGKKSADMLKKQKTLVCYDCAYPSPTAIIRQIKATCNIIEVWTEGRVIESAKDIQI